MFRNVWIKLAVGGTLGLLVGLFHLYVKVQRAIAGAITVGGESGGNSAIVNVSAWTVGPWLLAGLAIASMLVLADSARRFRHHHLTHG